LLDSVRLERETIEMIVFRLRFDSIVLSMNGQSNPKSRPKTRDAAMMMLMAHRRCSMSPTSELSSTSHTMGLGSK